MMAVVMIYASASVVCGLQILVVNVWVEIAFLVCKFFDFL